MNTREIVLDLLLEAEKTDAYAGQLLKDVLDKYDYLEVRDKAFMKRLTEGVLETKIRLDYVLDQFSSVPVRKMKPLIRVLMRMSVYQILYMDSVPDSAVCNEAVKLASKRKFQSLKGFVNGVLRKIAREKEVIQWPDPVKEPIRYYSVKSSVPEWIVELWLSQYGKERTEKLLEGSAEVRPLFIRMNRRLTAAEQAEVIAAIEETGAAAEQNELLLYAYALKGVDGVAQLPGFYEGSFFVQDVSSMLAVEAALGDMAENPAAGEDWLVVDVCAAPGGKAVHAAELLPKGTVLARDLTERKVSLIEENAERVNLANLKAECQDASIPDPDLYDKADLVIADLPCSGLGVMGRKNEIRYRVKPEDLNELQMLQRKILTAVHRYVKPGGLLLYSTCTVNRGENEDNAAWICEKLGFEPVSLKGRLPGAVLERAGEEPEGMCQLFAGDGTDGFFISLFRRPRKNEVI